MHVGAVLEQGGDTSVKTSMLWLVGAFFFHTLGELCLSPIGLSLVTKLAPLRLASLMMVHGLVSMQSQTMSPV
ncbi:di-/tripeptide transporter [Vibrio variabilis]|uniref:Di-/tripeptide transporter n=1 Tax=Vibrio variabilis TaxID=990271 RepID=A0ABQ0JMW8_9VIBR|nr:di-/tripeptide transporter [Vibrio variabilis]